MGRSRLAFAEAVDNGDNNTVIPRGRDIGRPESGKRCARSHILKGLVLPAGLEPAIRARRAIPNRLRLPVSPRQHHGAWGGSKAGTR